LDGSERRQGRVVQGSGRQYSLRVPARLASAGPTDRLAKRRASAPIRLSLSIVAADSCIQYMNFAPILRSFYPKVRADANRDPRDRRFWGEMQS
jgi:hypothetical protein